MAQAAFAAFQEAQKALVDALQLEYFCDDLEPPPTAFGWTADDYKVFYESGGAKQPTPPPVTTSTAPSDSVPAAPDGDGDSNEADPALMMFLQETEGFAHLCESMAGITWDEVDSLYKEGRPKLLSRLGKMGVKLSDRQKFVTVFGKATKPIAVKSGMPGGGRKQAPEHELEPIEMQGGSLEELNADLEGYQKAVLRDGIPPRSNGLFPPDDEFLSLVANNWSPFSKGLPTPCKDGSFAFTIAEHGWASGENSIGHGMDLRMFIKPGFAEPRDLIAGVRFSDFAKIGYGRHASCGGTVHGGAVETCLDEATAECAKTKLFPMATTSKIEFKITKPIFANVTYRVYCKVEKERVKDLMYEVSGVLTDAKQDDVVYATCLAIMANPSKLAEVS
jgi:hypothetical protein